jgi:hypothetical protein
LGLSPAEKEAIPGDPEESDFSGQRDVSLDSV